MNWEAWIVSAEGEVNREVGSERERYLIRDHGVLVVCNRQLLVEVVCVSNHLAETGHFENLSKVDPHTGNTSNSGNMAWKSGESHRSLRSG